MKINVARRYFRKGDVAGEYSVNPMHGGWGESGSAFRESSTEIRKPLMVRGRTTKKTYSVHDRITLDSDYSSS
jgi:hypothetical protein